MKAADVHALHDQDIVERVRNAREEAFNLRLRHATGELEDSSAIVRARRDVARLMTVARERGIDLEAELKAKAKAKETKR